MDAIFRKTSTTYGNGFWSWVKVVKVAREEPRRYGQNGELLISYQETEEHRVRRESVVSGAGVDGKGGKAGVFLRKGGGLAADEKEMDVKI